MKSRAEIEEALDLVGRYVAHPGKTVDDDTVNALVGGHAAIAWVLGFNLGRPNPFGETVRDLPYILRGERPPTPEEDN